MRFCFFLIQCIPPQERKKKVGSYRVPVAHTYAIACHANPFYPGPLIRMVDDSFFQQYQTVGQTSSKGFTSKFCLAFHPTCSIYAIFLFPFFILEATSDPPGYENPPEQKRKRPRLFVCSEMRADYSTVASKKSKTRG